MENNFKDFYYLNQHLKLNTFIFYLKFSKADFALPLFQWEKQFPCILMLLPIVGWR